MLIPASKYRIQKIISESQRHRITAIPAPNSFKMKVHKADLRSFHRQHRDNKKIRKQKLVNERDQTDDKKTDTEWISRECRPRHVMAR